VSLANSRMISIPYGKQGRFSCEVQAGRIVASTKPPEPCADLTAEIESALEQPINFPPLEQAVIPGDHVAIALDRGTPESAALMAATWRVLDKQGVAPEHITIVQPRGSNVSSEIDPRVGLPSDVRERVIWKLHDPEEKDACAYLAATAEGDRIYLARDLIAAEVVISIGLLSYDPMVGYRGTSSAFYPGLSDAESMRRARGQSHSELGPDDVRPLRQRIDEVAWLLGSQFSLQVVPSAASGVARVLGGLADSVFQTGKQLLAEHWSIHVAKRSDVVLVAVDEAIPGQGWEQLAMAIATARRLVSSGGRIIVLSELDEPLGPGMELVAQQESPNDAVGPLRELAPHDLLPATQIALAAGWASIYLMSQLDGDVVEDLFMVPLKNNDEVARLLEGDDSCAFLASAQFAFASVQTD